MMCGFCGQKLSCICASFRAILNTANKIWIEEDWTKQGIANDLLDAGVPAEDIVLGFQHPSKRPLTEFAPA